MTRKNRGPEAGHRGSAEWLPLDTARDSFTWLVTGPAPVSIDGRLFAGLPDRLVPLDELRDLLLRRRCSARTRDALWAHLVLRSRTEGATWTVACVGMALPALAASARWFAARYRGERADAHAAVLAGFLDALASVDLRAPGVLARLRWAAHRAGQAALEESLDAPTPTLPGFRSAPPHPPWGHPDLVLAHAVANGVLTTIEAELIGATRLEKVPLADWARTHGAGLKTTYSARRRAEQRLVAYLHDQTRDSTCDDPVQPAVSAAALRAAAASPPVPAGISLSVSGRRRNGRPVPGPRPSRLVRKTNPDTGLLPCGGCSPSATHRNPATPSSEVSRCA
ncbi:MAG TPA: hypothetical protein VFQ77_00265 [Pseudonocardiaceae bacterium]|jgi:hypothetical protein|nr:hypothetical protein [Pseudonocardiaceae bacterium]